MRHIGTGRGAGSQRLGSERGRRRLGQDTASAPGRPGLHRNLRPVMPRQGLSLFRPVRRLAAVADRAEGQAADARRGIFQSGFQPGS